jgi:hypothetical protein
MDPIENFERAVDIAHAVMQKVTPADLDKPTPCRRALNGRSGSWRTTWWAAA